MIRSRRFFACCALLAVVSFLTGAAQTQSSSAQSPPTQPAASPATFHTGTNLVLVDVVVRDKGKPVTGLAAADFRVLEDNQSQAITTFEEHKATDAVKLSEPPKLPPHVYADFPRYRTASAANILLLDALNTPMQDQKSVRQKMIRYLGSIPPGTQIAVFTLASRLRMVSGFTTDIGTIERALSQEHTPVEKSVLVHPEDNKIENDIAEAMRGAATDGQAADLARAIEDFNDDREAFQVQQQAGITIAALTQLGRYLSTIPGRKNLIWFSRAFPLRFMVDNLRQDQDYGKPMQVMEALLARARVAVYPVDAGGVMNLGDTNIANVTAPTDLGGTRDLPVAVAEGVHDDISVPQRWGNEQAAMKDLATATGGEAFVNTNDVGRVVEKAIVEGSNYYTLGYTPRDVREDGAWHTIRVQMPEGKYDLAYRRGYYATVANQPGQAAGPNPMTAAMEPGVPPLSQVIFEARVLPAGDPDLRGLQPTPGAAGRPPSPLKTPVTRYFIDYSIDLHELELKDLPDGRHQAELEITQALYDATGKRLNATDAGLEVTMTPEQMTRDLKSGVHVRQEIDVPADNVSLHLGVRDAASGRIGTIQVPVGSAR
ncbi:MAG TPA: VWA domain-containing protein [Acidobacteriaceae bacterium]|nr:VWA domain-containing protein [Acidobacteriaceae bacterium]